MKMSIWTTLFCGLFVFFVLSSAKPDKIFVNEIRPVQQTVNGMLNRTPVCLDRSDIPDDELHWLYVPSDPTELATQEYYGYLAGQLIRSGVVNASDCPLH